MALDQFEEVLFGEDVFEFVEVGLCEEETGVLFYQAGDV